MDFLDHEAYSLCILSSLRYYSIVIYLGFRTDKIGLLNIVTMKFIPEAMVDKKLAAVKSQVLIKLTYENIENVLEKRQQQHQKLR